MALTNIWQINGQTFSDRQLTGVKAQFISQASDIVTFSHVADYDTDPIFSNGETVTILRDGATWFKGTCTAIRRRANASTERIHYTISGPWWQLEQVVFKQTFVRNVSGVDVPISLAKLELGTDDAGARLHSGQVLANVLSHAVSALGGSALITAGTIEGSTQMPYEELNSLTCAEVIKRVLRWNPDLVTYFDYTTATPTLHIKRRSSLTSSTFALSDVVITDNSINPRHDLQRDGVIVQYERIDTVGSTEKKVIITDQAGTTSNPLKTLNLFFDLLGSSRSLLKQKVVTETIQKDSASWWQNQTPKLASATNVSVNGATQTAVDDGAENDGTSYTKKLVAGAITDWMSGVGTNEQDISADVTYTLDGNTRTEKMRLRIRGTNADDKTYITTGTFDPSEPTPSGLAAAILASISTLHYEGSISLKQQDAGDTPLISRTINIQGGRSEWASMAAQVYSVNYDLDAGSTQISFGPARHLAAADLFQLYRNTRTRRAVGGSTKISTGGSDNALGNNHPSTISADDSGAPQEDYAFRVKNDGDGTVSVSAGSVNTESATGLTPAGKPTELWLKATLNASSVVTGAAVVTSSVTDSATQTTRQIATIVWNGNVPTITQGIKGSQNLVSCGAVHYWQSLGY